MATCLNCGQAGDAALRFCPHCGQKTATRRLTLPEIGHEVWHALTHTDHSVLGLIKALLLRPGRVAREFVRGARKRYFNPFTFMVVSIGLSALFITLTGVGGFEGQRGAVANRLQRNVNWVILAQVPLLALWSRLLFLRSGLNFAEHLVLAAYTSGLRSLYFVAVIIPTALLQMALQTRWAYWQQISFHLLVWMLYFAWASSQFMDQPQRRWRNALLGALVAVLAQASSFALIWVAFWLGGPAR